MEPSRRIAVAGYFAILLAGLSLAPSYAHVLEAPPRLLQWSPQLWRDATVFNGQFRYFALVGAPIDVAAILACAGLAATLRQRPTARNVALAATGAFALGLLTWFAVVNEANAVLATWTPEAMPADFDAVRSQWEWGHGAVAALKAAGFGLTIAAVLAGHS